MTKDYDQTLDNRTKYSCSIYTMLNIMKYDYCIEISDSTIFRLVAYFEKIGVLLPFGAYFSIIYPAMCKVINYKTGLNLKVSKSTISAGLDDVSMWGLGSKKLSSMSLGLAKDKWITTSDMQEIAKYGKGSAHNHGVKKSASFSIWRIRETWGGVRYNTSLAALREGVRLGIYYDTARTLIPKDPETEIKQKELINKYRKTGKLTYIK